MLRCIGIMPLIYKTVTGSCIHVDIRSYHDQPVQHNCHPQLRLSCSRKVLLRAAYMFTRAYVMNYPFHMMLLPANPVNGVKNFSLAYAQGARPNTCICTTAKLPTTDNLKTNSCIATVPLMHIYTVCWLSNTTCLATSLPVQRLWCQTIITSYNNTI